MSLPMSNASARPGDAPSEPDHDDKRTLRFPLGFIPSLIAAIGGLAGAATAAAEELQPLRYNHPGLAVDLGVGLWAWPIPWDVDGDGDYDLIVSCPDKPHNGIWVFENTAGDTADNKFPILFDQPHGGRFSWRWYP